METIANHKADREELNKQINDYEETMEEFNNQVTDILQSQSSVQLSTTQTVNLAGINTVKPLEVFSDIQAIKTFWSGMVEADNTTKSNFSEAQNSVQELDRKMITFLEAIGKNGGKVDSLDIKELRSAVFEDQILLNSIKDKLSEGKPLSPAERDLLYQYLQNDFFDSEDHEKMEEISHLMQHDDDEKFKDYINEEVLTTEAHLEAEIMYLELYLFTGNERPNDLQGSEEDRIKWNNYLQVLKNAHMDINETREFHNWERSKEDPLYAQLENIEFEFSSDPVSGHSKSEITIMFYPDNLDEFLSKEELFNLDERQFQTYKFETQKSISDIEYFFGERAILSLKRRDFLDTKDEIRTYTRDSITAEVFGLALSLLPGGKVKEVLVTSGEYVQGNKKNEQKLSIIKLEQIAIEFELESQVSSHRGGDNVEIQLLPSEGTFEIIERWKAIHQVDDTIPYPETEIDEQDWAGLHTFMFGEDGEGGALAEMTYDTNRNIDSDIYKYIMLGKINKEDSTVKKAAKIINH